MRGCEFEFEMDEPAESGKSIESFDKGKTSLMRSRSEVNITESKSRSALK